MYLTETDPTHNCTVAIAPNPMVVDEVDREAETRDGDAYRLRNLTRRLIFLTCVHRNAINLLAAIV